MKFKSKPGEAITKCDHTRLHGEPGEVEFVVGAISFRELETD